jgi:hypothetical protein
MAVHQYTAVLAALVDLLVQVLLELNPVEVEAVAW